MKNILNTIIFVAAVMMVSCTGNSSQNATSSDDATPIIIDIFNPTIEIPETKDIIDTAFLIPLKGENLLMYSDAHVYKYGDRIFTTESKSNEPLKIFDGKGNLIRAIPKGGGPDKIPNLNYQPYYDVTAGRLYVSDRANWSIFDGDGYFIGKKEMPVHNAGMCRINDEYVFMFDPGSHDDNKIIVTDTEFKITNKLIPNSKDDRIELIIYPGTPMGVVDGHTYIMMDTIYWSRTQLLRHNTISNIRIA